MLMYDHPANTNVGAVSSAAVLARMGGGHTTVSVTGCFTLPTSQLFIHPAGLFFTRWAASKQEITRFFVFEVVYAGAGGVPHPYGAPCFAITPSPVSGALCCCTGHFLPEKQTVEFAYNRGNGQ